MSTSLGLPTRSASFAAGVLSTDGGVVSDAVGSFVVGVLLSTGCDVVGDAAGSFAVGELLTGFGVVSEAAGFFAGGVLSTGFGVVIPGGELLGGLSEGAAVTGSEDVDKAVVGGVVGDREVTGDPLVMTFPRSVVFAVLGVGTVLGVVVAVEPKKEVKLYRAPVFFWFSLVYRSFRRYYRKCQMTSNPNTNNRSLYPQLFHRVNYTRNYNRQNEPFFSLIQ